MDEILYCLKTVELALLNFSSHFLMYLGPTLHNILKDSLYQSAFLNTSPYWLPLTYLLGFEYEYLYCDDVLIVAKIINKSKRKNLVKIEMENVELVAPITASEARNFESLPKKDFASARRENPIYILVTVVKGKKVRILLEPSEKLLYCFRMKLGTRMVDVK